MQKILAGLFVFIIFAGPSLVLAQFDPRMRQPIVPCSGVDCTCKDLTEMANRILTYTIYVMIFVSAITFVAAGFQYLTAQGDASKTKKATQLLTNVAKGLAIALVAWLIVDTIVRVMASEQVYKTWSQICG